MNGLGPDPNSLHQVPATISNPSPQVGHGVDIPQAVNYSWNQPPEHHNYWWLIIIPIIAVAVFIAVRKLSVRARAAA